MKTLSQIKADILTILQDPSGAVFTPAELDLLIPQALAEISRSRPRRVIAVLTTTPGSRCLTLGEDEKLGLLRLSGPEDAPAVEYPVGEDPISLRSFTLFGDTLTILVDEAPAEAESVNLFLDKVHTLTESESTLDAELEVLLEDLAAARAAVNKARSHIGKINIGSASTPQQLESWGLAKLSETLGRLRSLARPGMYIEYPRS
jgi:hypothetical protein